MSDDLQVTQERPLSLFFLLIYHWQVLFTLRASYSEGCLQGSWNLLKGALILAASLRFTIFLTCIDHENNSLKNL